MSERPDVYPEKGTFSFRASSLGDCMRGLVASRLGIPPQPPKAFLAKAMGDSSLAEELVRNRLLKRGWNVEGEQEQVEVEYPEGKITGHLDGYVNSQALERSALEIKALGKALFDKYVRGGIPALGVPFTRKYNMQISSYMYATGLPLLFVVYGKDQGLILEHFFEEPPVSEDELRTRMAQVNSFAEREMWPECDAGCNPTSWYWHIHDDQKEVHRLTDEDLGEKLEKAHRLKRTIQALEDEHKTLTDELKEELGHGQKYVIGPFTATVAKVVQPRVDLDRLRRDHGEEFLAAYQYDVTQLRLTIRDKREAKGKKEGKKDAASSS